MAKDARAAWKAAVDLMKRRWDRASYETWLRPTRFIRRQDDTVVIGVPDGHVFDMLAHRRRDEVVAALREATGRPLNVEFRVQTGRAEAPDAETEMPLFKLIEREKNEAPPARREPAPAAKGDDLPESAINPRMVFERFIVNESNHLATAAARAVAEHPATVYNPFLVYGGVGIGKTHLLHAIANSCQERDLRVLYVSSEAFTNDLVHAIRNGTSPMFREKYRSVDVLLVDDIQFIRGKDTTQEEFFHTFNTLVNFNRQIVLASDRHPRELSTLEDRLRSRFQGGLVADIGPPELETRIAIMELWARERDIQVPTKVLHVIAERSSSCIRELNGLFNQIAARLRLSGGGDLSVGRAEATLNRYEKRGEQITVSHIIDVIAAAFNLDSAALKGKRRVARVNQARQVAMFLSREMTESSLPQIGDVFGRSHTTVLHGCNKIEAEIAQDAVLASRVRQLRKQIARV